VVPPRVLLAAYGLECLGFGLYAVLIHHAQPWYQKRHLTIIAVLLGVLGTAAVPIALVRRYPAMSAQEYEAITVGAFCVSFMPMAVQQTLRSLVNGSQREQL
jgi:hypothetical protein